MALPIDVLTVGVADGQLLSDYDGDYAFGGGVAYTLCFFLVTTPLITAGHVAAVLELGEGRTPRMRPSLAAAGARWLPVVAVVLMSAIGTLLGTLLLILPGIYLFVRWYVATPAVVAEALGPRGALRRSGELVKGQWWRVFGISLVLCLVAGAAALPVGGAITLAASQLDSGLLAVLGTVAVDAAVLSFTALSTTILYFDLRARMASAQRIDEIGTRPPVRGPEDPRRGA